MRQILAGSGITFQFSSANTVTLKKAITPVTATEPHSETTLKAMTVVGEAVQDPNDPFNRTYTVTNSSIATKTDTPIMNIPQSIQVVPRAVMNDQKAARITDALENVSGVRAQPSLGTGNNFIIRGFQNQNVYRNGLRANNSFRQEFDTANLQSIEVLKGPAQLYGRTEPGGLINLTTKKPLDIPYYSLEQRFGSYDLYRTEWDATGPVTSDKSLLYRFTGAYIFRTKLRSGTSCTSWGADVTTGQKQVGQTFVSPPAEPGVYLI
jgi:iron complex outermembrane receptor protein